MYLRSLDIRNFRTFRHSKVAFPYPGRSGPSQLPNVALLLGNNGMGKSSALQAIALALMTPVIESTGYRPYSIVRRMSDEDRKENRGEAKTMVTAEVVLNSQDVDGYGGGAGDPRTLRALVERKGTTEVVGRGIAKGDQTGDRAWEPMFDERSAAFFFVGYGASRTVESSEKADPGLRYRSRHLRYDRVAGLFEEHTTLIPLVTWLPDLEKDKPGRHQQVVDLINRLLPGETRFLTNIEKGEFLFFHRGLAVPFRALSDGFKAYIGWICDLLYHVSFNCPPGMRLVDNQGIVLIDEIDLHLHPEWQLSVLPAISQALPNLQFICTSHSPIVAGTVESANLLLVVPDGSSASRLGRPETEIHGLTADQILMSPHFGLVSTRAPAFYDKLREVSGEVSRGEPDGAVKFMKMISLGAGAGDLTTVGADDDAGPTLESEDLLETRDTARRYFEEALSRSPELRRLLPGG